MKYYFTLQVIANKFFDILLTI